MTLGKWVTRRAMTPEEKAAKKAAAKEQLKADRKEQRVREKDLSKKADAASAKAKSENTPEAHRAAAAAHKEAAEAYSHHYLNLRGTLAIHDHAESHRSQASNHSWEASKLEEKTKSVPATTGQLNLFSNAPKTDAPKDEGPNLMGNVAPMHKTSSGASNLGFSMESSARNAYERGNREQGHALARQAVTAFMQAHNAYLNEGNKGQAAKSASDAQRISKKADFHGAGINFNPDTHPRDEKGRFTSK